jgi:hypothetical protein
MVPTQALSQHVQQLLAKSKELAQTSHQLIDQGREEEGFSIACASAAYLASARAIMPQETSRQVPTGDKTIKGLDKLLYKQFGIRFPVVEFDYKPVKDPA